MCLDLSWYTEFRDSSTAPDCRRGSEKGLRSGNRDPGAAARPDGLTRRVEEAIYFRLSGGQHNLLLSAAPPCYCSTVYAEDRWSIDVFVQPQSASAYRIVVNAGRVANAATCCSVDDRVAPVAPQVPARAPPNVGISSSLAHPAGRADSLAAGSLLPCAPRRQLPGRRRRRHRAGASSGQALSTQRGKSGLTYGRWSCSPVTQGRAAELQRRLRDVVVRFVAKS
jgi:hypothetical protein